MQLIINRNTKFVTHVDGSHYKTDREHLKNFIKKYPDRLQHYVYALVDPRNDEVFYIGKGQKLRAFDHIFDADKAPGSVLNGNENKLGRIREIHKARRKVKIFLIHYGLTNEHALLIESALIDVFRNFSLTGVNQPTSLTNTKSGYDNKRGLTSVDALHCLMQANWVVQPAVVKLNRRERVVVITINGTSMDIDEIRLRVERCWGLDLQRAQGADYVAAYRNGIIVGLFRNVSGWRLEEDTADGGCFTFEAEAVEEKAILRRFLGRTLDIPYEEQAPIMYLPKTQTQTEKTQQNYEQD
ncbi:MAG: GIY-YIG nuclease family protein [Bacteroidaceae bacterium]|nr:GIY-YIG nuclease family protein [Bacteroidaceae bacterium]